MLLHGYVKICKRSPYLRAGLRDEDEVPKEDTPLLLDLVTALFPEVAESVVEDAIQTKVERKYVV